MITIPAGLAMKGTAIAVKVIVIPTTLLIITSLITLPFIFAAGSGIINALKK